MIARTRSVVLAACVAAAGCVTTEIEPDDAGMPAGLPVVIPLRGPDGYRPEDPVTQYYESALLLMHDAVLERDPERLIELCAQHDRSAAPEAVREQIARFRRIARVLTFEREFARRAIVELRGDLRPALGELVPLEIRCPILDQSDVVIGGEGSSDRASFQVRVRLEDVDCFGGSVERSFSALVGLSHEVVVGLEQLNVPFDLDAVPPQGILRRVRIDAALLPGRVRLEGERLPCQRIELARREFELFPKGIEIVNAEPMKTLRNALRSPDPKHLENVFLAVRAMPVDQRHAACEILIREVRIGDTVRARACMAALRELTGAEISVDDRRGWLRWWTEQATAVGESR
ncbi:MAG: hypothetical protein KDB80_07410 [Planctomycetes bacterium]|nr:hypothetical protein [Planctomycetota bacterium]